MGPGNRRPLVSPFHRGRREDEKKMKIRRRNKAQVFELWRGTWVVVTAPMPYESRGSFSIRPDDHWIGPFGFRSSDGPGVTKRGNDSLSRPASTVDLVRPIFHPSRSSHTHSSHCIEGPRYLMSNNCQHYRSAFCEKPVSYPLAIIHRPSIVTRLAVALIILIILGCPVRLSIRNAIAFGREFWRRTPQLEG